MPRILACWPTRLSAATGLLLAAAISVGAPDVVTLSAAEQQRVDGLIKNSGRAEYQNVMFGFGVMPGVADVYQGNATDDGVLIPLGGDREIAVNASYDAAELGSTKALMDSELSDVDPASVQRQPAVLDSQSAEQAQWKDGSYLHRAIVEYRSTGADSGINYTLWLQTDATNQQADEQAFDAVVKSFKHYQVDDQH